MTLERFLLLALVVGAGLAPSLKAQNSKVAPSFTMPVGNDKSAEAFESFIERNRGVIVQLNTEITGEFSRIGEKIVGRDDLFVATDACPAPKSPLLDCAGLHLLLEGKNYQLESSQGHNRINGYFKIANIADYHQGVYYILTSVPAPRVSQHTSRANVSLCPRRPSSLIRTTVLA